MSRCPFFARVIPGVLILLAVLSCGKKEVTETAAKLEAPADREWREFTVSLDEVKATPGSVQVRWNAGDEIALWDNTNASAVRRFTVVSSGENTAVIGGYVGHGASSFVAAYPYAAVKGRDGDNIQMQLPALQSAVAGGADASALMSVASGTGSKLVFKNVCALVKLTLTRDDIASLYLTGVSDEILAGSVTVSTFGDVVSVSDKRASIALKPASGSALAAGSYVIPVLPADLAAGFYVNAYDNSSRQYKAVNASPVSLARNTAKDAGAVDSGETYALYYGGQGGTKTSSTLNFYWDLASFSDREAAKAMPWRATLYKDVDCTIPVVSWDIPANAKDGNGAALFGNGEPRFIFTNLSPDTQYWFRATSLSTYLTTKLMTAKTTSFTPKTMQQTTARAGDVILAEDFSELPWFGDEVNNSSAGYIPYANYKSGDTPSDFSFKTLAGINPLPRTYQCPDGDARFFRELRNCVSGTRLDSWAEIHELNEAVVCARPGYVQIGASNCTGSLVTPPIDCIPEGKTATVRVQFKAAHAKFPENSYIKVQSVSGTVSTDGNISRTLDVEYSGVRFPCEATATNNWQSFDCEITGVSKGDRIAIGGDRAAAGTVAGSAPLRFMLDEVVLTVVSLQPASDRPYVVTVEGQAFHAQGIAYDKAASRMYFSFTTRFIVTDLNGQITGSIDTINGHLGAMTFDAKNRKVYASLECKDDEIGTGISQGIGGETYEESSFYIVEIDVDAVNRLDVPQEEAMRRLSVFQANEDYKANVTVGGQVYQHRYGCTGIDGMTIGPGFGGKGGEFLYAAYGVIGDTQRTDNDYQILLQYKMSDIRQGNSSSPRRYFVKTGNTTYGVQNLAYDSFSGLMYMAVYKGKKTTYTNYDLYAVNMASSPVEAQLDGVPYQTSPVMTVPLAGNGWYFGWGSMGLCPLGDGYWYIAEGAETKDPVTGNTLHTGKAVLYHREASSTPFKKVAAN